MTKSITIVFMKTFVKPTGGAKVAYEYANRLVQDGWEVYIAYKYMTGHHHTFYGKIFFYFYDKLKHFIETITKKQPSGSLWFDLDSRIHEVFVPNIKYRNVPKTDYYIATSVETPFFVLDYKVPNSHKFYLIQDYENWGDITDAIVKESYRLPLTKFVISQWLYEKVISEGVECIHLPNGFDFNYFTLYNPIDSRNKYHISILYHPSEKKGCKDSMEALSIVKNRYPSLTVNMFGKTEKPDGLPDWYNYYQLPDKQTHNKIYNESAIFIGASHIEGWGLTIGESMICGCAVACTDNDGFKEMVKDGYTGLLSPIKSPQHLANNIIKLIENDELRIRIARQGNEFIKGFTWNSSYNILKRTIEESILKN